MSSDAFHTTRWTLVRHATGHSAEGRQALSELCAAYYEPVVAFLRSGRDPDAAREIAHEFFAHLLEKPNLGGAEPGRGRFRNYLLGALKHHLSHRREHDARQKRGGRAEIIPLDAGTDTSPGVDPGDPHTLPPDREFDRQWALHVLRRATDALADEWCEAGKADEFSALQPFIGGEAASGALTALAAARGESPATLRKTVSRMRQRFRQHMKLQLAPTLAESADVDDEMRALLAALSA
ncbi:MAG TPA: sigma-70 family RNA polymerase sigma factor [Chthoniobacteraceae bacterium]|nr:sigma-70 family RNA polymerase sigma factor [Chthoniobacteraceae bacterium]